MHRPFTRAQALQNVRFLRRLAETGNARLAARDLGLNRSTFTKRRARSAAFARQWEAALVAAHAAFERKGGARAPRTDARSRQPAGLRTRGGEPVIVRLKNGRLQLRLALPGRMTKAAEQLFFRALSASANIRLAAAAAAFAHTSFLARIRRDRAFAAELAEALAAARKFIERGERTVTDRFVEGPLRDIAENEGWPEGLTIAQALRALGMPPLKLPGTPFPAKRGRGAGE